MPAASARATVRSWSAGAPRTIRPPTAPQPKPSTEPWSPVRPKPRICIQVSSRADDTGLAAKQKPRASPPGVLQFWKYRARGLEAEVDTGADDVGLERHVVGRTRDARAGRAAIELAEVDVEIFELDAPVRPHRVFHAETRGPADLGLGGIAERRRRLDVADAGAAGQVRQEVVPAGIAEAAARGREPVQLGLAGAAGAVGRALHARIVDVAFQAPDPGAGLEIVADGQAAEDALGARAHRRRIPIRFAEAVADIGADVEAGPIGIGRSDVSRRLVGTRQVGGMSSERHREQSRGGDAGAENGIDLHKSRPLDWSKIGCKRANTLTRRCRTRRGPPTGQAAHCTHVQECLRSLKGRLTLTPGARPGRNRVRL